MALLPLGEVRQFAARSRSPVLSAAHPLRESPGLRAGGSVSLFGGEEVWHIAQGCGHPLPVHPGHDDHRDQAERTEACDALVEQRLAACVQVVVGHEYLLGGEVQVADARRLVKSTAALFPQVCIILDLHPYEVPEVIAVPIVDGSEAYLVAWRRSVGRAGFAQ